MHFTYDPWAKQKLKVVELVSSIQEKLRIWKWRDLTIIGRIQIVKTFITPIFLYRASLILVNKEFVKDVNKIIFDFIIETQRVLCCKKIGKRSTEQLEKIGKKPVGGGGRGVN